MSDQPVDVDALIHKLTSGKNNNSLVETVGGMQHYYSCLEAADALRQQQSEIAELRAKLERIKAEVDQQAEDGGLWFIAGTAAEAYLQQELRRLHAIIESDPSTPTEQGGGKQ